MKSPTHRPCMNHVLLRSARRYPKEFECSASFRMDWRWFASFLLQSQQKYCRSASEKPAWKRASNEIPVGCPCCLMEPFGCALLLVVEQGGKIILRKGARLILNQYPNGLFRIVDTEYHISYVLFARGKSIGVFHVDAALAQCSEQFQGCLACQRVQPPGPA